MKALRRREIRGLDLVGRRLGRDAEPRVRVLLRRHLGARADLVDETLIVGRELRLVELQRIVAHRRRVLRPFQLSGMLRHVAQVPHAAGHQFLAQVAVAGVLGSRRLALQRVVEGGFFSHQRLARRFTSRAGVMARPVVDLQRRLLLHWRYGRRRHLVERERVQPFERLRLVDRTHPLSQRLRGLQVRLGERIGRDRRRLRHLVQLFRPQFVLGRRLRKRLEDRVVHRLELGLQ